VAETKKVTINNHSSIISNLFFEVYASPDIPVNKTSSGNTVYLQHKDSTSKMQLSYTFGIRIGAAFGEHFTGKIGFQYADINERFNYINKNATRTVPVVVERTLTDATGAAITVRDTSNLIQVGKEYNLTNNRYKSIDVPVLIGYETSGERLKASFNTGIILNIKTNYEGKILDASLNAVDINSNNYYKNNTGISLYFGAGISTKLNDNFRLFTEPYIKYRLNNMTGAPQPFTQKINVGGLSLGLRYSF
jgi:opacity protein-like surface antigen